MKDITKCCNYCKFYDCDYMWNDYVEDEVRIDICEKGHEIENDASRYVCEDFKIFIPKPHKDQFTKCDSCEYLSTCVDEGNVIDITSRDDISRHYTCGIGCNCLKRK